MRVPTTAMLLTAGVGLATAGALAWFLATRAPAPPLPDIPPPSDVKAKAHLPFGPVVPRKPAPSVALKMHDGAAGNLAATGERWRLVQLIFTNCATTCPLQGAIFQRTQQLLDEAGLAADLLSISIDPDHDDPRALREWLGTFGAGTNWRAGIPAKQDVGETLDFFSGRKSGLDLHDARVYFIDPQGRLAYASEDLPDPTALVALLRQAIAAPDAQSLRSQK